MADNTTVFNAADDYERFMGRWSRAIGEKFLDWLGPSSGARWLDVGCGSGAFSELIAKRCAPKSISGKAVQALDETRRARLRDHLRATLVAPDGTITYAATAIAGRGRKP
jgi:2-polyprenyl-3-methyl-5-hydroxy-6-metoxy-1,4-benzoquinol methylase